jgi:hypothetical protein
MATYIEEEENKNPEIKKEFDDIFAVISSKDFILGLEFATAVTIPILKALKEFDRARMNACLVFWTWGLLADSIAAIIGDLKFDQIDVAVK